MMNKKIKLGLLFFFVSTLGSILSEVPNFVHFMQGVFVGLGFTFIIKGSIERHQKTMWEK